MADDALPPDYEPEDYYDEEDDRERCSFCDTPGQTHWCDACGENLCRGCWGKWSMDDFDHGTCQGCREWQEREWEREARTLRYRLWKARDGLRWWWRDLWRRRSGDAQLPPF